jgi:hypothetical protein
MPEPLFILCPGRSFSSVVCAVIGQHPQCYGLPELNLFIGDTLGDALDMYQRSGRQGLSGLARTLAQLHDGEQTVATVEAANAWIRDHRALTPRAVLDHIQDCVGDRILVEKSPTNVISDACLTRILRAFPRANFLQLLRHPRSRGKSHQTAMQAEKARVLFNKMTGVVIDYEAKWTDTHLMIHAVGRDLPPGQMLRLHGETVLRDLRLYLPQICEWLDIRSDTEAIAAMLHPEDSPYSCIGPENAKFGANSGFLQNPHLDMDKLARLAPPTLDAPMDWAPDRHFSDTTRGLAHYYGYR